MKKYFLIIVLAAAFYSGCSSSREIKGPSYDPPGSVITTEKEIELQHRRTIYFSSSGVSASNEFEGGKLNDFYRINDTLYGAEFNAENAPINNSAWFAFKLWADKTQKVNIQFKYKDGTHRYYPKLSYDRLSWQPVSDEYFTKDTAAGTAVIKVEVGPDTLWISAQELLTSSDYNYWINELTASPFITASPVGTSREGRPIVKLEISETAEPEGLVYIIGRQHPPEVTGALALKHFTEFIASDAEIAEAFRKKYKTIVIPLVNPDGVDMGHWRHNSRGVDLNRDWINFNQKETRLVKEELLKTAEVNNAPVLFCIDFHSTQKDVFYITDKDSAADKDEIYEKTMIWFDKIKLKNPDYFVNIDPSLNNPLSPTSDSWMYNTFKCPALTYEIGDETPRELIKQTASSAAEAMMELLLGK